MLHAPASRVERGAPTKLRCGGGQAEAKVSRADSIGGPEEISVCPMKSRGRTIVVAPVRLSPFPIYSVSGAAAAGRRKS